MAPVVRAALRMGLPRLVDDGSVVSDAVGGGGGGVERGRGGSGGGRPGSSGGVVAVLEDTSRDLGVAQRAVVDADLVDVAGEREPAAGLEIPDRESVLVHGVVDRCAA